MSAWADKVELNMLYDTFGFQERVVIMRLARRLALGQLRYGYVDVRDGRDWREECNQEVDDANIYDAFDELSRE